MLSLPYARTICMLMAIAGQMATSLKAQTYVYNTVNDGNWTSNSTWQGGASGKPPVSGTCNCTIYVNPGDRLTINQDINIANTQIVLLGVGSELRFSSPVLFAPTLQLSGASGIELRNSGANIESTGNFLGYNGNSISINGTAVFQGYSTKVNSTLRGVVNGPVMVNAGMSPLVFIDMILPVKLMGFSARQVKDEVVLEWRTAGEENFDHFEIERSRNSSDWSKIATVDGRANGGTGVAYLFTDRWPAAGVNYYRLKMVDKDGQFGYSSIVVVNRASQAEQIKVYPNPAVSTLYISSIHPGSRQQIELINTSGQVVLSRQFQSAGNIVSLNVGGLGKGLYHLKVADASGFSQTCEVIIK